MNRNIKIATIVAVLQIGTSFAIARGTTNQIEFLNFVKSQNVNVIEKFSNKNIKNEFYKNNIDLDKIDLKQMIETAIQENDSDSVKKIFALAKALGNVDMLFKKASNLPDALKTQNIEIINKTLNEEKSTSILTKAVETQNLKIINQVLNIAKQTSEYKNLFETKNNESVIKTAIKTNNPEILKLILKTTEDADRTLYTDIFKKQDRNSLLAAAILTKNETIIDIIFQTAKDKFTYENLFITDNSLNSVLAVAIDSGDAKIVQKILDIAKNLSKKSLEKLLGANTPFSVLKHATIGGTDEIVNILIKFEKEKGISENFNLQK